MKAYILSSPVMRWFLAIFLMISLGTGVAYSQAADAAPSNASGVTDDTFIWFLVALVGILVLVVVILVLATLISIDFFFREKYGHSILPKLRLPQIRIGKLWGATAGGSKQQLDKPLDHSYDGIVELDNAPPPLFNYILYGSIIYAVVYMLVFHVFKVAPLQDEEYQNEVRLAEAAQEARAKNMKNFVDENTVVALTDDASLAKGKTLYMENCAACHGQEGQGLNGPNLTDEYWIHGGSIQDIFKVVKYGVLDKGMINWETVLKPAEIAEVSSFILTLQGTNPPNAKEPQGEKYVPEPDDAHPATQDTEPADAVPADTAQAAQASAALLD